MANEPTKVELTNSTGFVRRFTIADGVAIAKNTILVMTDPRTAAANTATAAVIAGISSAAKEASDGETSLGVWTDGIFEMTCSGAVVLGCPVQTAAPGNMIMQATTTASGATIIGYALETGADLERINVRLRL